MDTRVSSYCSLPTIFYCLVTSNLKRVLEVVNTVADSRYKLYEDFINEGGRNLAEYVTVVRQAILAGLEHGGSDPFRIIAGH